MKCEFKSCRKKATAFFNRKEYCNFHYHQLKGKINKKERMKNNQLAKKNKGEQ